MKKTVAEPIIEKIDDNVNALDQFGTAMTSTGGKTRNILLDFPTL